MAKKSKPVVDQAYSAFDGQSRSTYDERGYPDIGLKGVVIPSANLNPSIGASAAYDPNSVNIKQNLVEFVEDAGMRIIGQTTRAEMAASQGIKLSGASSDGITSRGETMPKAKRGRKKAVKQTLQRAVESVSEQTFTPPVMVQISGAFGTITQPFSAAFVDNKLLVLVTDLRRLPTAYKFPEITNQEPIPLAISWGGQTIQALHAGICFTLPDGSGTFSVLFINSNEETSDGEGLSG
jgi:hypothetical protein